MLTDLPGGAPLPTRRSGVGRLHPDPAVDRRLLAGALLALALLLAVAPATAQTARALTGPKAVGRHLTLDGFTNDWAAFEELFCQTRFDCDSCAHITALEESDEDSKWGSDNDLSQIRITWDADALYLGIEAVTSGNNVLVWVQPSVQPYGIAAMAGLNAWRRNFTFANDFEPLLFGATWDNNATPQAWSVRSGTLTQITDSCRTVATFSGTQRGRSMELAIPWSVLFPTSTYIGRVAGVTDTFQVLPAGAKIRIAGAITAGGDGTGGPDTAPDVTRCLTSDGNADVTVDNYAIVDLDRINDLGLSGLGANEPDGMPDWGVKPRERVTFLFQPPLQCISLTLSDMKVTRPAFAPQRSMTAPFTFTLTPRLDPNDPVQRNTRITMSAYVYDLGGNYVRTLYSGVDRPAVSVASTDTWPVNPAQDFWNGRDANGELVPPGVYVLRLVLGNNISRLTRPLVVVR